MLFKEVLWLKHFFWDGQSISNSEIKEQRVKNVSFLSISFPFYNYSLSVAMSDRAEVVNLWKITDD